jgi:hypothetical protein
VIINGDMIGMVVEVSYIILMLLSWNFLGVTKENCEKSLLGKQLNDFIATEYIASDLCFLTCNVLVQVHMASLACCVE